MSTDQASCSSHHQLAPPRLPQDMKQLMAQEMAAVTAQLAALRRERDDALAEQSLAQEEARVAVASKERALAAAAAAQRQLQSERDAVMTSLSELQVRADGAWWLWEKGGGNVRSRLWLSFSSVILPCPNVMHVALASHQAFHQPSVSPVMPPGNIQRCHSQAGR